MKVNKLVPIFLQMDGTVDHVVGIIPNSSLIMGFTMSTTGACHRTMDSSFWDHSGIPEATSSEVLRMLLISEGKFSRYPNLRSTDRERERTNDQHLAQK